MTVAGLEATRYGRQDACPLPSAGCAGRGQFIVSEKGQCRVKVDLAKGELVEAERELP